MKKIRITLVDRLGKYGCAHRIGESYDYDTERGKMCPTALHTAMPFIGALQRGAKLPVNPAYGSFCFCCPDPDVINVYKIEPIEDEEA